MSIPVVTIGVCVRNCEAFLRETVNGIRRQDFPHESIEVIFVDDGSVDRTPAVLRVCAASLDMTVKMHRIKWKGLGTARQIVVDNASGDYIIWVDCGMKLSPDHVSKQVEFMEKNPEVGIAKGKYGMSTDSGLLATLEEIGDLMHFSRDTGDFNSGGKNTSKAPGTGGSIFRVKAIKDVGGFDKEIKGACEDTDVAYRIRKAGWSICATNALFYPKRRNTIKSLLAQHFRYGYGLHYIFHKHPYKYVFHPCKMVPLAGFLEGLLLSHFAYKSLRRRLVFLLPLSYTLRRVGLCCGFTKSHMDSHGHAKPNWFTWKRNSRQ